MKLEEGIALMFAAAIVTLVLILCCFGLNVITGMTRQ